MSKRASTMSPQKQRRKQRTSLTIIKFLFIVVLLSGGLLCLPVFRLKNVTVQGLENISQDTIMNAVADEMGKHILRVDKQAIEERIEKITYVADATVQTKFPNSLEIVIKETTMVGYIKFTGGVIGIDGLGKVIETAQERNESIPVVDGVKVNHFVVGEKIAVEQEETLETILTCLNAIHANGLTSTITKVDVTNLQDILLQTSGQVVAKCGSSDQLEYKIAMFSSVLPQVNLEMPGTVDLRIAGQAIYNNA